MLRHYKLKDFSGQALFKKNMTMKTQKAGQQHLSPLIQRKDKSKY